MRHQRSVTRTTIFALGLCGAAVSSADAALVATRIFAVGDSLTDGGNFFLATGQPPPPYNQRFSNGPVWVEHLAQICGAAPLAPSLAGGTNLAWGFARATDEGVGAPRTPSLGIQVGQFLASGQTPTSTDLFVVWAGANDLFDGQPNPILSATAVVNQVKTLTDAGAKQLVVMNLPPIQDTPDFRDLSAAQRAGAAMWVDAFNMTLASGLDSLTGTLPTSTALHQFDTAGFFNDLITNPGNYGLTNVTDRAFNASVPSLAPNPEQYLFWDGVHPTTTSHRHLAVAVCQLPEPAAALVALPLLALLGRRRRTARAA